MSTARHNGDVSKDVHENNMEHLVKCVGILFGIRDNEDGPTADSRRQPLTFGVSERGDSAEVNDENQPTLSYKKRSITEIFRSLGFSVDAENPDNRRLVEAIFPSKSNNPKADELSSFRFNQQAVESVMQGQSNIIPSLPAPAPSRNVRKNFAPPRPIQKRSSPPRNLCDDTLVFASTSQAGPITDSTGNSRDNNNTISLNAFCKKLSANPTGTSQNNIPAFSRRSEAPSVGSEPSNSRVEIESSGPMNPFKSAYEQMIIDDKVRGIKRRLPPPAAGNSSNVHVSGLRKMEGLDNNAEPSKKVCKTDSDEVSENPEVQQLMLDERLKNVESKMVEAILNEIMEIETNTQWDDIAGLEGPKDVIREIIIWPILRPDIFTGLRGPPKGVLLFGPPGTGKTMIGRLIATQSKSSFFNISASSLTSKWIGDGEKMVRALFQVARVKQPSVIFIDEIDSILTQRSDTEHESSRRLKTEFLIQFDGCGTASEDRILVIGVTNRPQELDEAARRRLVKRVYIPLPDKASRKHLVERVLMGQNAELSEKDFETIAQMTDGYSGADMSSLVREAAYGPIRDIGHDIEHINVEKVRPIQLKDFEVARKRVKASVASHDLSIYENWDEQFGCHV